MEGKMKKYRQVSPERAKIWTEKSPKYHYNQHSNKQQQQDIRKVPVVYYLCKNRQLEHPHFMEVPLSSPDGLYLRDVIQRLNVLRGRGIASIYSWSCKRSYKNGFVWHDLCEDDLILPAHGNEYVLKGSELFEASDSALQNSKALPEPEPEPASSRSQEESSSSSSLNSRTAKNSQDGELSPPIQCPGSSAMSPESSFGKNYCWNGPLRLTEYKIYKDDGFIDASTQTEESSDKAVRMQNTCTIGVSTDEVSFEPESSKTQQNRVSQIKEESSDTCRGLVSPFPSPSGASPSSGKIDTLASLMRADARKLNSFRIVEEEEFRMPSSAKLKPSNMLIQLISCGSISVKDHNFGLIPTYKPRFSYSKFSSPFFSTSPMSGELDCLAENPRQVDIKHKNKEHFSESLVKTNMLEEEGDHTLKRSSSYNADRPTMEFDPVEDKEEASSARLKCIPRSVRTTFSKQSRCEPMSSPISKEPRILSDEVENSRTIAPSTPDGRSKRITEPLLGKAQTTILDSARGGNENVIQIEERLASGARIIIRSRAASNYKRCS